MKGPVTEQGFSIVAPRDWLFAAQFSPVFYQETNLSSPALPGVPAAEKSPFDEPESNRADFITRVDYDGNWIANDNWQNFDSPKADFRAFVYFSTAETLTHFFIFYTVFHPKDIGSIHENDLEGAVVVVEKGAGGARQGRVAYVETLAHGVFYKYFNSEVVQPKPPILPHDKLLMEGNHPLLYIEPRGHGIKKLSERGPVPAMANKVNIVYRYKGRGENPAVVGLQNAGYDLIPLYTTLWKAALLDSESNATFTEFRNYGEFQVRVAPRSLAREKLVAGTETTVSRSLKLVGASLWGNDGRPNAAHPPWGWSLDGRWFFLPAEEIKKDYHLGEDFSLTYVHHPFLQIYRSAAPKQ